MASVRSLWDAPISNARRNSAPALPCEKMAARARADSRLFEDFTHCRLCNQFALIDKPTGQLPADAWQLDRLGNTQHMCAVWVEHEPSHADVVCRPVRHCARASATTSCARARRTLITCVGRLRQPLRHRERRRCALVDVMESKSLRHQRRDVVRLAWRHSHPNTCDRQATCCPTESNGTFPAFATPSRRGSLESAGKLGWCDVGSNADSNLRKPWSFSGTPAEAPTHAVVAIHRLIA